MSSPWTRWFPLALAATVTLAVSGCSDEKKGDEPAKGQTVILGTYKWDIEENKQGDINDADVWWEQVTDKEQFLVPRNGLAVLGKKAFDKITREDLTALTYSDKKLASASLAPGTMVALRTNEGNFAKLKVVRYRESHDFSFQEAKLLDGRSREFHLRHPNRKNYHLEVQWVLYRLYAATPGASAQTVPGTIIFASERDGQPGLFVMEADGSNQRRLTSGKDFAATWSRDGCRLVFRRGLTQIHLMNADGSDQRLLVRLDGDDPAGDLRSHFSPDGRRILFNSNVKGYARRGAFVINTDGSGLTNLTHQGEGWGASWSPDGSKILFGGGKIVNIMNADGTGLRRLADGFQPTWSPDGSKIAFTAIIGRSMAIVVTSAAGADSIILTHGSGTNRTPVWSPDGSKIAFEALSNEDVTLQVMNMDGTNRTTLDNQVAFSMNPMPQLSWSPDGSRVVFPRMPVALSQALKGKQEPTIDIYSVEVDGGRLKRLTTTGRVDHPIWSPTSRCEKRP